MLAVGNDGKWGIIKHIPDSRCIYDDWLPAYLKSRGDMVQMQEVPQIDLGKAQEPPTYAQMIFLNLHHTYCFSCDVQ